jgi:hypothetical protein
LASLPLSPRIDPSPKFALSTSIIIWVGFIRRQRQKPGFGVCGIRKWFVTHFNIVGYIKSPHAVTKGAGEGAERRGLALPPWGDHLRGLGRAPTFSHPWTGTHALTRIPDNKLWPSRSHCPPRACDARHGIGVSRGISDNDVIYLMIMSCVVSGCDRNPRGSPGVAPIHASRAIASRKRRVKSTPYPVAPFGW